MSRDRGVEGPRARPAIVLLLAIVGISVAAPLIRLSSAHPVAIAIWRLVGAVTAALYYLSGRRLRAKLDLVPYVTLVYGACLAALLVIALIVNAPLLPQPPREWAIFTGLALGPMLLGHTGMNWALGHLPAYVVNITVLGEPVGAILLGALLPGIREIPTAGVLAGGAVVAAGILMALPRRQAGH